MSGLRRVSILVAPTDVEIARAWVLARFPDGFEEGAREGESELAVYTDAAGEAAIQAVYPVVRSEPVAEGWEDRWKEFHRPVWAGGVWIGPPWIAPPPGATTVVVDPGRAFGTGAHPTTRVCVELLTRVERASLLDAGCGSGVLSVAAAKLGFGPVMAVDADADAVEVARTTARANGVELEVRRLDVLADPLPAVDIVVANIELRVVERLLERTGGKVVVTSGYLADDMPAAPGWTRIERLELEGWAGDAFTAAH